MNLVQALKIIDSGEVFSLQIVSFDKARKKGGKLRFYSELKVSTPKISRENKERIEIKKTPARNHFENATRTCFECINGEETSSLVTIHIFLMLEVNGEKVML